MDTLIGISLASLPFLLVVALFALTSRRQRRRLAEVECQIRLTDAVHARVGAAVAPVVRHPLGRPWEIHVATPLDRRDVVDSLLEVIRTEFGASGHWHPEPFQIVLSPTSTPRKMSA